MSLYAFKSKIFQVILAFMLSKWCLYAFGSYLIFVVTFNFDGHLIFKSNIVPFSVLLVYPLGFVFNPKMWGKKVEDGVIVSWKLGNPFQSAEMGLKSAKKQAFWIKISFFDANLGRKTREFWLSGFPIWLGFHAELTRKLQKSLGYPCFIQNGQALSISLA